MALNPSLKAKGGRTSLSEINVTPMVDVMLVLLIVFMVSAPLLQQGIDVKLPKADAGNLEHDEHPILITVRSNRSVDLDGRQITLEDLTLRLNNLAKEKPDPQILVQADQDVSYGTVAKVMAKVKKANIRRVGLVTAPEEGAVHPAAR
jgi:biopolymer transport protein TolR